MLPSESCMQVGGLFASLQVFCCFAFVTPSFFELFIPQPSRYLCFSLQYSSPEQCPDFLEAHNMQIYSSLMWLFLMTLENPYQSFLKILVSQLLNLPNFKTLFQHVTSANH